MQGETPPTDSSETLKAAPVEQAWSLAEPVDEQSSVAAAEGAKRR